MGQDVKIGNLPIGSVNERSEQRPDTRERGSAVESVLGIGTCLKRCGIDNGGGHAAVRGATSAAVMHHSGGVRPEAKYDSRISALRASWASAPSSPARRRIVARSCA